MISSFSYCTDEVSIDTFAQYFFSMLLVKIHSIILSSLVLEKFLPLYNVCNILETVFL